MHVIIGDIQTENRYNARLLAECVVKDCVWSSTRNSDVDKTADMEESGGAELCRRDAIFTWRAGVW